MSAKQAIHDDLKAIDAKIRELEGEKRALNNALAALEVPSSGVRRRSPRERVGMEKRKQEAREAMSAKPTKKWTAQDLPMPTSSGFTAIKELLKAGEVEEVGRTPRGAPIVLWKTQEAAKEQPPPPKLTKPTKPSKPKRRIKKTDKLSLEERQRRILDILRSDPRRNFSVATLSELVGVDRSYINFIMRKLNGKVIATQPGKGPKSPKYYRHKPVSVIPGLGIRG